MENNVYTPMEQVLIKGALLAQALETKKKAVDVAKLDLMLLEMERQQDMMDGLQLREWIL